MRYGIDLYPSVWGGRGSEPLKPYSHGPTNNTVTLSLEPKFIIHPFWPPLLFPVTAFLTVKKNQALVFKDSFNILSSPIFNITLPSTNVEDHYYVECSVRTNLDRNITQFTIIARADGSEIFDFPSQLNQRADVSVFSVPVRGWSYPFLFNFNAFVF